MSILSINAFASVHSKSNAMKRFLGANERTEACDILIAYGKLSFIFRIIITIPQKHNYCIFNSFYHIDFNLLF